MADEDDHLDDNAIDAADERIADSQTVRWWALARLLVASRPLPAFSMLCLGTAAQLSW